MQSFVMKVIHILALCLIMVVVFFISSCSNDLEEEVTIVTGEKFRNVPVCMDATLIPFDASMSVKSRATTLTWKEGDVIYLQYTTADGSTTNGTATYHAGNWTASDIKSLKRDATSKCVAYYFDGEKTISSTSVTINPTTGVYADLSATYYYPTGGTPTITCNLKPQTSRIRFKGTAGTSFSLTGLSCRKTFTLSSATLSKVESTATISIQSNGYSPYIYGNFASTTSPQLIVIQGDATYTADCKGRAMLITGESGYINLPTSNVHNGWEMKLSYNGHEYVDLGLPSGTKWATCNIGASSPEMYGDYYAWGEVKTKTTYGFTTYKYCNGSETSLTKYCTISNYGKVDNLKELVATDDVATVKWGASWCMPTDAQLTELFTECDCYWSTLKGNNGVLVKSKKNDQSLFLPAAGCRAGIEFVGVGEAGFYWSRTLGVYPNKAYDIIFIFSEGIERESGVRAAGQSVRPVRQKG